MRKFDNETLQFSSLFTSTTGVSPKDCFKDEDEVVFVVDTKEMGRAIGKKGANIQRLKSLLKKDVRLVEYVDDPAQFLQKQIGNTCHVSQQDGTLVVKCPDAHAKGKVYGRDRSRLKKLKELVQRFFSVDVTIE